MPRKIERYGWRPSLPDPRDRIADTTTLPIHSEVDPRADMPNAYDQGELGSCTANAVGAAVEYDDMLSGGKLGTPSRLDIYYGERVIEGSVGQDAGAFGRDGFKFAHKTGVIPEADWPYDIAKFTAKPPADVAHRHTISSYSAVPRSITAMKRVLSNQQTIAFGFSVFASFESEAVAKTGVMPVPGQNERMAGGHEVLMVGYVKDHPHHALCRNSWGPGWGLRGYFLMPWAVILDPNLSSDFRTIRRPAA